LPVVDGVRLGELIVRLLPDELPCTSMALKPDAPDAPIAATAVAMEALATVMVPELP
jgi:hypothetical protein